MSKSEGDKKDVRNVLSKVALATAQATLAATESGSLEKEEKEYILTTATLFERSGLTSGRQKVIRELWDVYAVNRIVEEIKESFYADFEFCAQHLTRDKRDTPTVRGDLGYFLLAVVSRTADELSVESVPNMVERLLFEYEGGSLDWTGELWLSGVRVSEPIQIKPGLILRPPVSEDFTSERPSEVAEFGSGLPSPFTIPDSVLEFACKSCDGPDFRQEINALCLFRLGAVEVLQEEKRSNSIFPYVGGGWTPLRPNPFPSFTYELSRDDAPFLAEFLNTIARELPIKPLGHHEGPRWLGLKNYFRALHTASDVEERLGQAVASLEASLLAGEMGELSYRLSLRTASLLRHAGFNPSRVFTDMRTAYNFRSRYTHGGEIGAEDLEKARELCRQIMDYARLAVVKLLEFPDKKAREELLKLLDLALLDDGKRRQLEDKLGKGLWLSALQSEGCSGENS